MSDQSKMIFLIYIGLFPILWTLVHGQNCTCGKEIINTRIVGGQESKPNVHLWAAALVTSFKNEIFCGGSLINDRYILTAAHCLTPFNEDEIKVALGFHSLSTIDHLETVYEVESIIPHPEYEHNDPFQLNDIALLKLDKNVEFTSKIQPICLPFESLDIDYESSRLLVVGWGKVSEDGDFSDKLREAYIPFVNAEECIESYNSDLITDKHICAGELDRDSCYGDSGNALVWFYKPNKVYQLGIVSWGIECGSKRPGVYTKLLSHLDWINENTEDAIKCY